MKPNQTLQADSIGEGLADVPNSPVLSLNPLSEAVGEIRNEAVQYSETVPAKYRPLYLKVIAGKASPRKCIKAKCQECMGYEDAVNRISGCATTKCPMWNLRPYQGEGESHE